jgi:hypothetical protein
MMFSDVEALAVLEATQWTDHSMQEAGVHERSSFEEIKAEEVNRDTYRRCIHHAQHT